jgi:hypothetical protein
MNDEQGKGPILAVLLLGAVVLLIIGLTFAFTRGTAWPTPTGFFLAAIATFGAAAITVGGGKVAVLVSVLGYLAAAVVFIGHYIHFF